MTRDLGTEGPVPGQERIDVGRPKILDLFCGAGGAGMGYSQAGFDVIGVDIEPQPRYPFEFHQGDALAFLSKHGRSFDAIHASPPCQGYSIATAGNAAARAKYPRLIEATRDLMQDAGKPWVIENVAQARKQMVDPILLCGRMFGLGAADRDGEPLVLDRHRLFETSIPIAAPEHGKHSKVQVAGVYGGARLSSKVGATPADDRVAAKYERRGWLRSSLEECATGTYGHRLDDGQGVVRVDPPRIYRVDW